MRVHLDVMLEYVNGPGRLIAEYLQKRKPPKTNLHSVSVAGRRPARGHPVEVVSRHEARAEILLGASGTTIWSVLQLMLHSPQSSRNEIRP